MTGAALLRKMNPRGGPGTAGQVNDGWGGNAWQSGASEGENVRSPGETEEKTYEEVECGGKSGAGGWVGRASGGGAGCGEEERSAKSGGESDAGGARAMERHLGEADRHGGGFSRGQGTVPTASRA